MSRNGKSTKDKSNRPEFGLKEYKTLFPYISQFKYRFILGFICLIIIDAAQIIIPQFIRMVIDLIYTGNFEWKQIIFLCLIMTIIMAVISAGRFLWRYFISGSARTIEAMLREKLFSHLQKMSYDFYQKNKIGDLMARSINDLQSVRRALGMGLVALFDSVFMTTAILIIVFVQDAQSAKFAIIPLPLITLLILLFGGLVGKKFRTAHEAYSKMSDNAQETFAGINVVKSFVKEWWFIKKFSDSNDEYRKANMEVVRLFGFFFPFIQFLSGLTILVMLVIGGRRVIMDQMSPGSLVAMFRYLTMLIWPLMGAGFMVNMIQRGAVSLGRINEILNTEPSIQDIGKRSHTEAQRYGGHGEGIKFNAEDAERRREEEQMINTLRASAVENSALEINNLSFSYDQKNTVLSNISFSVKRGEWLGIMGRTGAGKSTLIKTFTRTIDPPSGTVKIFGIDVKDWSLDSLRGLFAVSPQDSYLFSDSIASNIAYGLDSPEGKEEAVNKAINFASLERDLEIFANGKDTMIGERGITLSGGQKQRTAIARAVVMDSEFLILDDSLSAVDNETEKYILNELLKERKSKTTILISHRVSTLKYVDKVLVLDDGKILEYGSPQELILAGGFYNKMASLQSLEGEKNG